MITRRNVLTGTAAVAAASVVGLPAVAKPYVSGITNNSIALAEPAIQFEKVYRLACYPTPTGKLFVLLRDESVGGADISYPVDKISVGPADSVCIHVEDDGPTLVLNPPTNTGDKPC